ncbi:hypothetical protein G7077_12020 [Sphingomonas piscis]|uniref:Putative Flp pilus-assembly TadG-like N-terminal domain-containing protein n=1 Tax=Sphingomonas piscis TaxID=2714943 RepID=A0A6G7YS07_9SPHN|nr:Tad domain-containing protein [Sphingomonas piscis]QIK79526.1 hypothetical protein G7077_12020 [Sphingomonas piscis]
MISRLKKLVRNVDGNALMIAAASMPLMMGAAGLGVDAIQWALWKRQLQRTADSAAIAAVYGAIGGQTRAAAVARDLIHNSHLDTTPTITYPTPLAPYATDANAVRVQMTYSRQLSFSSYFMSSVPVITANATATVVPSGDYCVVSLETEAVTGINATGSTRVNLGCGMVTNSPDDQAAVATGNSSVTANPMAAVGQIPASDNWGAGTVLQPFTLAQADPFASVAAPVPSGTCSNVNIGPQEDTTLAPGCYSGMTIKGKVVMSPGTYVIDGGDFTVNAGADISCAGCTFVLTNRSTASAPTIGTININAGAELDLSAPDSSTNPFNGILFYQDRRAAANNDITINGGANMTLKGAVYLPRANLKMDGNASMTTTCFLIAAKRVTFTGNSSIDNNCPSTWLDRFKGRRVRLVG